MPRKRRALAIALSSNSDEWCLEESDPDDNSQDLSAVESIQENTENQEELNQSGLPQENQVSEKVEPKTASLDSCSSDDNYRNLILVPLDIKEEAKDVPDQEIIFISTDEENVAAPSRPRERKRPSAASNGPKNKKTKVQRVSQRDIKKESSKYVDEKFKKAKEAKEAYNASLKELDRALEEKLKTHQKEANEIERKIQELVARRKKLKKSLQTL